MVRTQRLVDALSSQEWMQKQSGTGRIARSTLSDALKRFEPEALRPLIRQLVEKIPGLRQQDGDLLQLTRQIVAADGSFFNLAGEVAWALHQRRGSTSKSQSRVRLNLQLDIATFVPLDMDLSGCAIGDAIRLWKRDAVPPEEYASRRARLTTRLQDLITGTWEHPEARRLLKRLRRHQDELFTFLDVAGVPFENNHAERAIRPAVIIRKNSQCNRSQSGAHTQALLMSVYRTLKQRGHPPIDTMTQAIKTYLSTGQLPPLPPIAAAGG
jgi:hypothetical protein